MNKNQTKTKKEWLDEKGVYLAFSEEAASSVDTDRSDLGTHAAIHNTCHHGLMEVINMFKANSKKLLVMLLSALMVLTSVFSMPMSYADYSEAAKPEDIWKAEMT